MSVGKNPDEFIIAVHGALMPTNGVGVSVGPCKDGNIDEHRDEQSSEIMGPPENPRKIYNLIYLVSKFFNLRHGVEQPYGRTFAVWSEYGRRVAGHGGCLGAMLRLVPED